ncbi:MAG: hypothetical protein IKM39_04980 [Clostridia bacterium]|nr:hypothetical protein [Clostridia bacterium]
MNQNAMNDFFHQTAGGIKTNPKAVKEAIDKGDISKIAASMSKEDMDKVQAILADKEKMDQILRSPLAKTFLKQFGK